MSPIAIRNAMRRLRRHVAGLVVLVALGGAIAMHHSGITVSDRHHEGMGPMVEMCAGAFVAVGAAMAVIAMGVLALGRWPIVAAFAPTGGLTHATARAPAARAGPCALFAQLCVWRR